MKNIITFWVPFFCSLLILSLFFACKKDGSIWEVPPLENPTFLRGKWIEKEPEEIIQFEGTNHIIEFSEDQFFLKFNYWTDALSPDDECLNGYTAYFKGSAAVLEDSISFTGQSTNEFFDYNAAECDRYATFQKTYKYKVENEEVIILNPDKEVYFQIRLEKE